MKDVIPDLACLIALKVKYCYELANMHSEAEKWLIKAKGNDVFHNFDFFLRRFKNIIKS